jgi:hypothetical protein
LRKVLTQPSGKAEYESALRCTDVKTHIIYPSTMSDAELYGEYPFITVYYQIEHRHLRRYDPLAQSWSEGLIQHLMKQIQPSQDDHSSIPSSSNLHSTSQPSASNASTLTRHWMVFDGSLQGSWLQPIHYVCVI